MGGVGSYLYEMPYAPNSVILSVSRIGDEYSFYCNNSLIHQQSIPLLDGMPLYFGVGNEVSSGPSGLTAQTAFDNLSFEVTPVVSEPGALGLLGLALLAVRKKRS